MGKSALSLKNSRLKINLQITNALEAAPFTISIRGRTRKDDLDQHGVRGDRSQDESADGGGNLGGLVHGERHGWILRT